MTRDVLIIEPFTVPRRFQEAGLTSEVMANRIGDRLRQIEIATQTRMKKDNLISFHDEGSMLDVEIPGTKVGLKTVVDITRSVFKIYVKRSIGDIVVPADLPAKAESPPEKPPAKVTVYLTQGRNRSAAVTLVVSADDLETLVQRTAETVLGQVNPYVLAAYRNDHREYEKAVEIVEGIVRSPSEDLVHKKAALILWGNVLDAQKKYDEAIAKYQESIKLDPKYAPPYNNWGNVLHELKKYDEAITRYRKSIDLDPKDPQPYIGWGNVLHEQKKYDEAIAKYQKSIELDPKYPPVYNNWGLALDEQKRYDEAIAKYQKPIDLDPKYSLPYVGWGNVLVERKEYDEAIAKYQKSVELDPNYAPAYYNWGLVLKEQRRSDEADEKLAKARELMSSQ